MSVDASDGREARSASDLPARIEAHEAEVWVRCVELASSAPGDPLGAVTDPRCVPPLAALTAVRSHAVNRVVGLGVVAPANADSVLRIVDWYRSVGQDCFRVELAPCAAPPGLEDELSAAGLRPIAESSTKLWRALEDPELAPDLDRAGAELGAVRRLTAVDADAVAALNVRAWGAWQNGAPMSPWFSATVGREGFDHYGLFVDDRLVSTGAMAIGGELAWIGFDATHPRYRSRELRRALTCRRIADARAAGCRIVHAEARTDSLTSRARLLHTLYVRRFFVDEPAGSGEPATN